MRRSPAILIMTACALMLCLAIVGCGGNDTKANFVGVWELETLESTHAGEIDASMLRQVGAGLSMTLDEDGSAYLDLPWFSTDATWELENTTSIIIDLQGEAELPFVLAEGKLVGNFGEITLIFAKASSGAV